MSNYSSLPSAHNTFPLTRFALGSLSLTPEFDYRDPYNARLLNARLKPPLPPFTAAEISAVGLMGLINLRVIDIYAKTFHPALFSDLDDFFIGDTGYQRADESILYILDRFPTSSSFFSPASASEYLFSSQQSANNRHGLYQSFLLIMLADNNFALRQKDELFTDPLFRKSSLYISSRKVFEKFFICQPGIGSSGLSLLSLLSEPANAHPGSLEKQLDYIKQNWAEYLGDGFNSFLLSALDRLKEESKPGFIEQGLPENPLGYSLDSSQSDLDTVHFSIDQDWMPKVILIAKNVFVWMDQLSKQYPYPIYKLDQIPDEELEKLSRWGITGLWLIGLWQRSPASQKIKQICGNPDAVPSAYSLYDYVIAETLGGEKAYLDLQNRAERFGIRLAADMVPNHMGIFSKWVLDRPDWFLGVSTPPFPGYSFQGPDLSDDQRISIYLEDHYYDKSDASVVFKRVDNKSGFTNYIYHGNDGTAMPWNDTAQLDFLNPEAREAIIQTILHVARKFPIIRFDAAMTLAKKHIQRLWFPEPGTGGAIATRSDYGLSKKDFDLLMPEEFWREVVDRVAQEAPGTLLLAEAFWMMEGYFVRNLGMHRVYNSAFMHMLREEDNTKYRDLIIKTLEYDPQILKRYVNFMNNPDEETAVAQFGSDGKYFGVCVLMVTLPGLPMFGHGQIEGLTEKYGMEYQRAYYSEQPNLDLINRHEKEIFPLLHKRYLFAEVENFFLYNLISNEGSVNEDVFVYSNRYGNECALIVFHNKWGDTSGSIQQSVSINGSCVSLLEALGLNETVMDFLIFKEQISGLEYILPISELKSEGLFVSLGAFHYKVFIDFRPVHDPDGSYKLLASKLNGQSVPDLQKARIELVLAPLAQTCDQILSFMQTEIFSQTTESSQYKNDPVGQHHYSDLFLTQLNNLDPVLLSIYPNLENFPFHSLTKIMEIFSRLEYLAPLPGNHANLAKYICSSLGAILLNYPKSSSCPDLSCLPAQLVKQPFLSQQYSPETLLELENCLQLIMSINADLFEIGFDLYGIFNYWFSTPVVHNFIQLNKHDNVLWFNQESFESLVELTFGLLFMITPLSTGGPIPDLESLYSVLHKNQTDILLCMKDSNYKLDSLKNLLSSKFNLNPFNIE